MTAWINHVREYAQEKGIKYSAALKDPECSASYKNKKTSSAEETPHEVSAPKKRGRPRKYVSKEEAKQAKREMTTKSNRKKKSDISTGEGLIVVNKTENNNGLGHIYPLSHEIIMSMLG